MKQPSSTATSFAAALTFALGILLVPGVARAQHAQNVSETHSVGDYSVTLKVLPAEHFTGTNAEMVKDSGAAPKRVGGPDQPNHHLVVFIKKDGKPVEHARVSIDIQNAATHQFQDNMGKMVPWAHLGVVRMHVAGQGPSTTHYGNNVNLAPGTYDVRVTVNGSAPVEFQFSV